MLELDLTVFAIQTILFLLFLSFSNHFIIKPVQQMLEKRKELLDKENVHSVNSKRTLTDLREYYRQELELAHKLGSKILVSVREKALLEVSSFISSEREKALETTEKKRQELLDISKKIKNELAAMQDEFVTVVIKKLWRLK